MKNISIKSLLVVFKTYISNLPKSIKVLLLINIVIYFISIIIDWVFSYNLKYTFGVHPTCSEKFKVYQIFTNDFFHDINHPDHIIGNLILLLLFAPAVSRIIGDNNTIKLYVFSGLISFLSFNYIMNIGNNETVDKLTKTGFDVKKIKQDNYGCLEMSSFDNANEKQKELIHLYRKTSCLSYGASGSISGFIIIFPFLFIKRKKSILLNLLVLLIVIDLIDTVITNYNSTLGTFAGHNGSATFAGHLGGVIGGIVFFIVWLLYLKNKTVGYLFTENKKVIQNEAAPILQINAS